MQLQSCLNRRQIITWLTNNFLEGKSSRLAFLENIAAERLETLAISRGHFLTDLPINDLLTAFAAGFCIQQLLEIADPVASLFLKSETVKKSVLGLISLALGLLIAIEGNVRIFQMLGDKGFPGRLDAFLTAVFISAGTEGFNSLLKFANYKKEEAKASAADQKSKLTPEQLSSVNFRPRIPNEVSTKLIHLGGLFWHIEPELKLQRQDSPASRTRVC